MHDSMHCLMLLIPPRVYGMIILLFVLENTDNTAKYHNHDDNDDEEG